MLTQTEISNDLLENNLASDANKYTTAACQTQIILHENIK